MPKTGRSRLIIAWLLQRTFYILWIDNNNDLPTLDKFCKFATSCTEMGHKYSSYWLPTGLSGRSLPVLCGYLNFQRTIDFIYFKYQKNLMLWFLGKKTESKSHRLWLVICFFSKKLWTMVMQELGLWCFENHDYDRDNHQGSVPVSDNHSTPVPTRCWLKFFWPK